MGLWDDMFTNKKEKVPKADRSNRPTPNINRAPPGPVNVNQPHSNPTSTFDSLRRLKGKVATSTPKKPSIFYADLDQINSKPRKIRKENPGASRVDNNGNNVTYESAYDGRNVVNKRGKENIKNATDIFKRPESRRLISSRQAVPPRENKAKSSTLSLQSLARSDPKIGQVQPPKRNRPVTVAFSSNISTRRGHKEGQGHPDNLSRTSSITNLDSLEASLHGQQGKGAKPRKAASKERIDKQGQDGKKVTKNNNKLEPPLPATTGQPLSYSSDSLQEVELHQLRKQLRDMADEKSSLALQLGEQRGQLNVLQNEILKLKSFQEESNLEMEKLAEENTALRNRLRDVAHSPLSDNEKQQLLFESRHHNSAPASIATNVIDDTGGDATTCTTPDWDKHSSGNVSEVSVACLQDKINQMQETHYSTNEELQATLQELTDLQRQLTELQQENERLNEEKTLMFDSLCRQTERLTDSRQEVENLKQLLYRDRTDETGINQFESAVEREQKLVELLRSAQEEREQLLLKLEQVQAELHDSRTGNAEKSENISQLMERVGTLECTLDAKHAEHKQLDQELAQAKDQCSGKQIEINRLSDLLENARTKINELEQDRTLSDKSELDELLDNARKEKDQLESEVTYLKEQLARSKNEIEKLKEQVFVLQEECKVTRNNAKSTQSDLEYKCEKLIAEKTALGDQLQQFQEAINELQVQAQCHLEDKRQLSAVLSETQRNMSESERKNLSLENEIQELKKLRAEENDEWEKFQNDLLTSVRVANDFKTEAQQELQKIILENKTYRERVRLLEGQVDKLKGEKPTAATRSTQTDIILTPQIISLAKNLDPTLPNRLSSSSDPTGNMDKLFPILNRDKKSKSKENLTDVLPRSEASSRPHMRSSQRSRSVSRSKENEPQFKLKKSKSRDDLTEFETKDNEKALKRSKSKDNLKNACSDVDHKDKGSRSFLKWNRSKENLENNSGEAPFKEKKSLFKRNKSQENLQQMTPDNLTLGSDKPRKSQDSSSDSNKSDPKPEFFSKLIKKREKKPTNRAKATHPKFISVEEEILLKSLDNWYNNIDQNVPDELLSEEDRAIRKLKILYEDDMIKEKPIAHKPKENLAISKPLLNSVVLNPKLDQFFRDPNLQTVDSEVRQSALEEICSIGPDGRAKGDEVYTNIGPPFLGIHKSNSMEDANVFEEYRTESELAPVMYRATEAKHVESREHVMTRSTIFSDIQPNDSVSNARYSIKYAKNDLPKPNIYINYENLDEIVAKIPKNVPETKLSEEEKFALKLKQALDEAEKKTTLKRIKKKYKSIRGLEISVPTPQSVEKNWKLKEIMLNPGIKKAAVESPKKPRQHNAWKRHSTDISSDLGSPHETLRREGISKSYEDIHFSFVPENTFLNLYYKDQIRASKFTCETSSSSSQSFTSAEFNLDTGKIVQKFDPPLEMPKTNKVDEDLLYNETLNKTKNKRHSKEALIMLKKQLEETEGHHPKIRDARDSYKNEMKHYLRRMENFELRSSLRKQRMGEVSEIDMHRTGSDSFKKQYKVECVNEDHTTSMQYAEFNDYRHSLRIDNPLLKEAGNDGIFKADSHFEGIRYHKYGNEVYINEADSLNLLVPPVQFREQTDNIADTVNVKWTELGESASINSDSNSVRRDKVEEITVDIVPFSVTEKGLNSEVKFLEKENTSHANFHLELAAMNTQLDERNPPYPFLEEYRIHDHKTTIPLVPHVTDYRSFETRVSHNMESPAIPPVQVVQAPRSNQSDLSLHFNISNSNLHLEPIAPSPPFNSGQVSGKLLEQAAINTQLNESTSPSPSLEEYRIHDHKSRIPQVPQVNHYGSFETRVSCDMEFPLTDCKLEPISPANPPLQVVQEPKSNQSNQSVNYNTSDSDLHLESVVPSLPPFNSGQVSVNLLEQVAINTQLNESAPTSSSEEYRICDNETRIPQVPQVTDHQSFETRAIYDIESPLIDRKLEPTSPAIPSIQVVQESRSNQSDPSESFHTSDSDLHPESVAPSPHPFNSGQVPVNLIEQAAIHTQLDESTPPSLPLKQYTVYDHKTKIPQVPNVSDYRSFESKVIHDIESPVIDRKLEPISPAIPPLQVVEASVSNNDQKSSSIQTDHQMVKISTEVNYQSKSVPLVGALNVSKNTFVPKSDPGGQSLDHEDRRVAKTETKNPLIADVIDKLGSLSEIPSSQQFDKGHVSETEPLLPQAANVINSSPDFIKPGFDPDDRVHISSETAVRVPHTSEITDVPSSTTYLLDQNNYHKVYEPIEPISEEINGNLIPRFKASHPGSATGSIQLKAPVITQSSDVIDNNHPTTHTTEQTLYSPVPGGSPDSNYEKHKISITETTNLQLLDHLTHEASVSSDRNSEFKSHNLIEPEYNYKQILKENQYGVISPLDLRYTYRSVVNEYKTKFPQSDVPDDSKESGNSSDQSDLDYQDHFIDEFFKPVGEIDEVPCVTIKDDITLRKPGVLSQIDEEMDAIMNKYLHTRASLLVKKSETDFGHSKPIVEQKTNLKKYNNFENLQEIGSGVPSEETLLSKPRDRINSDALSDLKDEDNDPLSLQDLEFIAEMKAKYASVDTISTISDKSLETHWTEDVEVAGPCLTDDDLAVRKRVKNKSERPLSELNESDLLLIETITRRTVTDDILNNVETEIPPPLPLSPVPQSKDESKTQNSMIPTRKNLPPSLRPKKPAVLQIHQPQNNSISKNKPSSPLAPKLNEDQNPKRLLDLMFKETIFVPLPQSPESPNALKYKKDSNFKERIFVCSPEPSSPSGTSKIPTWRKSGELRSPTASPKYQSYKETLFVSKTQESPKSEVKINFNKYSAIPQPLSRTQSRTSWSDFSMETSYEPVYQNIDVLSKSRGGIVKTTISKKPLPLPRISDHLVVKNDVSDNMTDPNRNSSLITNQPQLEAPIRPNEDAVNGDVQVDELDIAKTKALSEEAISVEESKARTNIVMKVAETDNKDEIPEEPKEVDVESVGAIAIETKVKELDINETSPTIDDDVEEIPRAPSDVYNSNVNLFQMDSHSSYDSYLELFKSKESKEFDDLRGKKPHEKGVFGMGKFTFVEKLSTDNSVTSSTDLDGSSKETKPKVVDFVPLDDQTTPVFTKPSTTYDTLEREKTFHVLEQAAKVNEPKSSRTETTVEESKEEPAKDLAGSLEVLARNSSSFSKSSSKSHTSGSRTSFTQAKKIFEALVEANKEERPRSAITGNSPHSRGSARDSKSFEHLKVRSSVNKESAGFIPKSNENAN